MAKKNWYKGITATAVAVAMAGAASTLSAFAEDTTAESVSETSKTTETYTQTDAVGREETVTTTTTTETKDEKDPDFKPTTSTTEDVYVDSAGNIIHTETKVETSESTSTEGTEKTETIKDETTETSEPEGKSEESIPENWQESSVGDQLEVDGKKYIVESNDVAYGTDRISTQTVVMSYTTEEESPITKEELSKALGKELTLNEDGTYSYVNGEGKPVTVTITRDESSNKTKVTLTISESRQSYQEEVEKEFDPTDITNIKDTNTDNDKLSVTEILGKANEENSTYDESTGRITSVVIDGRTYKFSYDESEEVGEVELSNEELVKLLGKEYSLDTDGNVVYEGNVLTFEEKQEILRKVTITVSSDKTIKVDDLNYYSNGNGYDNEDDFNAAVEENAKINALLNAAKAEGLNLTKEDIDLNNLNKETGVWTYTKEGTTYSFTLGKYSSQKDKWDNWNDEEIKDAESATGDSIYSGSSYELTGKYEVTGVTQTWTSFGDYYGKDIPFYKDGVLSLPEGVNSSETTVDGVKTVSFEYEGKTYKLVYTDLTEDELNELKKDYPNGFDFTTNNLKKVTYTVTTQPQTITDTTVSGNVTNGAQIITRTEGTETKTYYVNGTLETELTPVEGKDGVYTDADGKTYTVKGSTTLTDDQIQTLLEQKFTNVTVKDGVATYVQNGVTYTVNYSNQVLTNVSIEEKQASGAFTTEAEFVTWVRGEIAKAKTGKYGLSIGGTDLLEKDYTDAELAALASTVVNYHELTEEQLTTLLVQMKAEENKIETPYKSVDTNKDGVNDKAFDHIDLNSGSTLTIGDETENCILLRNGLTFKVSTDAKTIVTGQVQENADGTTTTITDLSNTFKDSISYDQGGAHYEYQHRDFQSNLPAENAYYCVTGTVVYGDYKKCKSSNEANAYAKNIEGAYVVKVSGEYRVYTQSAELTAYGYMTRASNNCKNKDLVPNEQFYRDSPVIDWVNFPGYDLEIADLTMTEEGKVVAHGKDVKTYSADLVKVSKLTGSSLKVDSTSYTVPGDETEGSDFVGHVTVKNKTEKDLDVNGSFTGKAGYYRTKEIVTEYGTAEGEYYAGVIEYKYDAEEILKTDVISQTETTRKIDADVKEDSTKTVYNYTTKETVTEGIIGHIESDDPTPTPTPDPVPEVEPTVDPTPTPAPTPSIPDEVIDDIIAEVEEEVTPIVSVPKTGAAQNTAAAAASAAALGGIAFALSRKRRRK